MQGTHVIVAGAGLAGLSAAHELSSAGARVTVLEARGRAGGRVWTAREPFIDGQYGELGAEFVDEDHARIRSLARTFGVPLVRTLRGGFTHRLEPAAGPARVSRAGPWPMLADTLHTLIDAYRAAGGRPDAPAIRRMAATSLREWLQREHADENAHAMADSLRGFFLAEPDDLSVLPVVAQLAGSGSPAHTPVYRLAGGTDRLVAALAAALPEGVLLRHVVRAVARTADRVLVRVTDERGRQQELAGDAVVMALPAATLREVTMTPDLPPAQARAIRRIRYGCATKVVVQCAAEGLRGRRAQAFATDGPLGAFWDATDEEAPPRTSVTSFLGGGAASRALGALARSGPPALLSPLCWLGLAGATVVATHMHTWEDDPFAGGGYVCLDPAFDPAGLPLLGRRAGRVVFAGEHTSRDHQGYMEGAVESGQRAARELLSP